MERRTEKFLVENPELTINDVVAIWVDFYCEVSGGRPDPTDELEINSLQEVISQQIDIPADLEVIRTALQARQIAEQQNQHS